MPNSLTKIIKTERITSKLQQTQYEQVTNKLKIEGYTAKIILR